MTNLYAAIIVVLSFVSLGCGTGPEKMGARKAIYRYIQNDDVHGDKSNQNQNGNGQEETGEELTLEELREVPLTFGIRSFDQIGESMAVLTTVSPLTQLSDGQSVQQKYGELASQLPESNDAKAFLASHQVAISKLAVEYCDALMNDNTKRSAMFPSVNFSQGANSALMGGQSDQFAMELVNQFWGEGLNNRPSDDMLQQEITTLIQDLLQGENGGNANSTLNVTKGACAAVLASAPAMFL